MTISNSQLKVAYRIEELRINTLRNIEHNATSILRSPLGQKSRTGGVSTKLLKQLWYKIKIFEEMSSHGMLERSKGNTFTKGGECDKIRAIPNNNCYIQEVK